MSKFLALAFVALVALASLAGTSQAQYGAVAFNRFGQPVFVANSFGGFGAFGGFGFRRPLVVNRFGVGGFGFGLGRFGGGFGAVNAFGVRPVFVNRFVPGVGFVTVRVR